MLYIEIIMQPKRSHGSTPRCCLHLVTLLFEIESEGDTIRTGIVRMNDFQCN